MDQALGIAFWFARRPPSVRFSFGYGRVEDLAGVVIVLVILSSALVAGYQSYQRFLHPQEVSSRIATLPLNFGLMTSQ